jgi:DNA adenine methylase
MKPLFSYYGGKQRMSHNITPIIDSIPHKVYVEPFAGGATMYWAKAMHVGLVGNNNDYRDVLNDTNDELINFFRVCQDRDSFKELLHRLKYTPHSRELYAHAKLVTETAPELDRAWAWYILIEGSYAHGYRKGYAYGVTTQNNADTYRRGVDELHQTFDAIVSRLRSTFIERVDALVCIQKYDSPHTLLYLDPPYIDTHQGHYKGYTREDYGKLLECLSNCQSSFVLSGYMNDMVPKEWECVSFDAHSSASAGRNGEGRGARVESVWVVRRGMGLVGGQMEF